MNRPPKQIEKPLAAVGKLPSDIDGDTPTLKTRCPGCGAFLAKREAAAMSCDECGASWRNGRPEWS